MLTEERKNSIIAKWIFLGVFMLVVQVLLGGITRLTGSGLSITEWKPIMGALPPLNETQWQEAFEQYKQIAQYKYLNNHFELGDFKFIFFWEWFHRLWARMMGIVFLIPFIYFLWKGYFKKWMINPLIMLFLLGAMQGAIGWIMVQSGLNDSDTYVSHIRLSIHFVSAMVLTGYALIFGLKLIVPKNKHLTNNALKNIMIGITILLVIQLFYGAFMAGLKAAAAAPTWPLINGSFFPYKFGSILYDRITIHFIHRSIAYILIIAVFIWWLKARKINTSSVFNTIKNIPLILVLLQTILGIISVLTSQKIVLGSFGIFEWFAVLHQFVGMLLLLSMMAVIYVLRK
ncbi:MAG: COX15/CtaA family protein [Chitinophagaceae bacterium]|nr:COX15/CtaA family protein [Chitinophagaceae bacterium]MCW5904442.1 COX15/CtaA family protein [Chitinophagaceae bacterium]